jgi:hypothetical protein
MKNRVRSQGGTGGRPGASFDNALADVPKKQERIVRLGDQCEGKPRTAH